jgi:hypothetical protein
MADSGTPEMATVPKSVLELCLKAIISSLAHDTPPPASKPDPEMSYIVRRTLQRCLAPTEEIKALTAEIAELRAQRAALKSQVDGLKHDNTGIAKLAEDRGIAMIWLKDELARANWHIEAVTPYHVRMVRNYQHMDDGWYEGKQAFERSDPGRIGIAHRPLKRV